MRHASVARRPLPSSLRVSTPLVEGNAFQARLLLGLATVSNFQLAAEFVGVLVSPTRFNRFGNFDLSARLMTR